MESQSRRDALADAETTLVRSLQSSAAESFAYFGDREGWFIFLGQHRDSDTVTRSNFRVALASLGGEDEDAGVAVERFNHWAVGWTESILIRPDALGKVKQAAEMLARLEDYPILSDDDQGGMELSEACDYWARMSLRDRLEACHESGVSPFAARRDEMPEACFDSCSPDRC